MLLGIDASRATAAQRTGTENYSLYLIRALIAGRGEHQLRLYFNDAPAAGLFEESAAVEWRVIPAPRLWTHLRLADEVRRHPPDVLFVPAHVLPRHHPPCCVATVHDLGYRYYPQAHTRRARLYLEWATRFNAREARRVVVDSEATRDDLARLYGVDPARMVVAYPAGVDDLAPVTDPAALAAVRERYGIAGPYLAYVGTLQPRKNLANLLRAFGELVAAGRVAADVQLVLAGRQGWLADEIMTLSRDPRLAGRVLLPGYVPAEDLATLLSGALGFVLPSWYEGFGLPILEAMACNTPVICSRVSSLPEVAGDAALYVDPADVAGLADAMARLVNEPALRADLVARGRQRLALFSWARCAAQVWSAIEAAWAECRHG
jgi:glycosyltransferase involved in cell wall biosynthesis